MKEYIQYEKDWVTNPDINHGDQAIINRKNDNIRSLEEILQNFESQEFELKVRFSAPLATELPHLAQEQFNADGIRIEGKGGILLASESALQSEFVSFLILSSISILSGSITIADFIFKKLQILKNIKCHIGDKEIDSNTSLDRIREMITEELEKVKEEDFED